jgi:hypothetical protein
MKIRILSLLALVGVLSFVAMAADVSGSYKADVPGRQGNTQSITINLKADGSTLTGAIVNPRGETPISDGKVDGNKVSFNVTRKMQDNEVTTKYSGVVEGDTIKFTMVTNFNGNERKGEFVAKKQ